MMCNGTKKIECPGEHNATQVATFISSKKTRFDPVGRWKVTTTDSSLDKIFFEFIEGGEFWGKAITNSNNIDFIGSWQFSAQSNQLTIKGIINGGYYRTTIIFLSQKDTTHIGLGDDGANYCFIPHD